jgi:hypothetical protein
MYTRTDCDAMNLERRQRRRQGQGSCKELHFACASRIVVGLSEKSKHQTNAHFLTTIKAPRNHQTTLPLLYITSGGHGHYWLSLAG